jgi:hypothetical protein
MTEMSPVLWAVAIPFGLPIGVANRTLRHRGADAISG